VSCPRKSREGGEEGNISYDVKKKRITSKSEQTDRGEKKGIGVIYVRRDLRGSGLQKERRNRPGKK